MRRQRTLGSKPLSRPQVHAEICRHLPESPEYVFHFHTSDAYILSCYVATVDSVSRCFSLSYDRFSTSSPNRRSVDIADARPPPADVAPQLLLLRVTDSPATVDSEPSIGTTWGDVAASHWFRPTVRASNRTAA